jgi:phosphoenolpyruvate phosphomutase
LQGADELREAETRFLPRRQGGRAVVLAASRGEDLGRLTWDRPKTMIVVKGEPLLAHIVAALKAAGIHRITVVRGYAKEKVDLPGLALVDNDDFEKTGELHSLLLALRSFEPPQGDLVVCYGDVLFRRHVLELLHETEADLAIAVDTNWRESANLGRHADYVVCSAPLSRKSFGERITLERVSGDVPEPERHGEWMGLLKIGPRALPAVRARVESLLAARATGRRDLAALLNALAADELPIQVAYTTGNWLDVDSLYDVIDAERFP